MADSTSSEVQTKNIDSWARGLISAFPRSRLQEDALNEAYNVVYNANGTARSRGSFDTSGIPDLDENWRPLGADFVYKKKDGTQGLFRLVTTLDWTATNAVVLNEARTAWNIVSPEVKFESLAVPSYAQVPGKIVIANGKNLPTYYDIEKNKLVRAAPLDDPAQAPGTKATGLGGTPVVDYFYRIAISGTWGETKMTPPTKVPSSALRNLWNKQKSVEIDVTNVLAPYRAAGVVENVTGWSLYISSVTSGSGMPGDDEYLILAEGLSVDQNKYIDDGTKLLLGSAPVENTTKGVICKFVNNISGRLWGLGVDNNVYWGGDAPRLLYFGTANGAGKYELDNSGVETPMTITLGRDNSGTSCINLLTRTNAGQGHIWDVYATTNSVNSNGQTFTTGTYQFKQREGNDGTDAPFSVIRENNNAYYLSTVGFKSTGVKPNVTGIQSTDIITSAIRDKILNLSFSNVATCYGAYFDECLFWTVAYGTIKNNEIWVYDILHGGIWSIWEIEADCIFRWASSNNDTPGLYLRQGRKLLKYYKNSKLHSDVGKVFHSRITSGLVPFHDSFLIWVHLLRVIWQFITLKGVVKITICYHGKNGEKIKENVIKNLAQTAEDYGWGNFFIDENNDFHGCWNNIEWDDILTDTMRLEYTDNNSRDPKFSQKIKKNVDYISYKVECNTAGSMWELSHIGLLYTYIGNGIEFLNQKEVTKL